MVEALLVNFWSLLSVRDRVVIVTGGTGSLGSAVVRAYLDADARVVVASRRRHESLEMPYDWDEERVSFHSADVLVEKDVEELVSWVLENHGRINVLVNTVGGWRGGKRVDQTDLETWNRMLDLNLKSVFLCSRAVIPTMMKQEGGSIINISSRAAIECPPSQAAYNVAKGGVVTFTRTMAAEMTGHGVTVNAVLPKTIDTVENREANPEADFSRWVKPEAIARIVLFLTSEAAKPISGAAIPIHGDV